MFVIASLISAVLSYLQRHQAKSSRESPQTAKTQYRKFETIISRKGIERPESKIPHSCVFERFIYSHDWYAYFATEKHVDRSWELYKITHRHMNVEMGLRGRAIPRKGIHKWDFRCSVQFRASVLILTVLARKLTVAARIA
jgi:hypothetical protein